MDRASYVSQYLPVQKSFAMLERMISRRLLFLCGLAISIMSVPTAPLMADSLGVPVEYKFGFDERGPNQPNQPNYAGFNHYRFDFFQFGFLPDEVGSASRAPGAGCFLPDLIPEVSCDSAELIQTADGVSIAYSYDEVVWDYASGSHHIEISPFQTVDFFAGASLGSYGTYRDSSGGYLSISPAPEPAAFGVCGLGILALTPFLRRVRGIFPLRPRCYREWSRESFRSA